MTPARRFRIYLLEARFQFVEVLREPMFAIPTLAFPLIFYLFFGVIMGARGVSLAVPTYVLATYGSSASSARRSSASEPGSRTNATPGSCS